MRKNGRVRTAHLSVQIRHPGLFDRKTRPGTGPVNRKRDQKRKPYRAAETSEKQCNVRVNDGARVRARRERAFSQNAKQPKTVLPSPFFRRCRSRTAQNGGKKITVKTLCNGEKMTFEMQNELSSVFSFQTGFNTHGQSYRSCYTAPCNRLKNGSTNIFLFSTFQKVSFFKSKF